MSSSDLTRFGRDLAKAFDDRTLDSVRNAMGRAGKQVALDAATRDLGPDRSFSGMNRRRRARLDAGYDLEPGSAILKLRPKGLWTLADQGRRRSGPIRPRRNRMGRAGNRPALAIGGRFRATSTYRPARGNRTVDDTMTGLRAQVPKAAAEELSRQITRAGF